MRHYLNSMIIGNATAIITVIISSFASYGLSKFKFKMKNSLIIIILFTQILPMEVLAISYFKIVTELNLYNNMLTLIILDCTITIPPKSIILTSKNRQVIFYAVIVNKLYLQYQYIGNIKFIILLQTPLSIP